MVKRILSIAFVAIMLFGGSLAELKVEEEKFYVKDEESTKKFAQMYINRENQDELYAMLDKVMGMRMPKTYFLNQLSKVSDILGKFEGFGKYFSVKNEDVDTHVLYLNFEHKTEIMILGMGEQYRTKEKNPKKDKIYSLIFAMTDKIDTSSLDNTEIKKLEAKVESKEETAKFGEDEYKLTLNRVSVVSDAKTPNIIFINDTSEDNSLSIKLQNKLKEYGISSTSFNLRVKEYNGLYDDSDFTPYNAVVDDAVSLYNILIDKYNIDKDSIYLVAHGDAAYYLPAIVEKLSNKPAGLFITAGNIVSELYAKKAELFAKLKGLENEELAKAIRDDLPIIELIENIDSTNEEDLKENKIGYKYAYYYYLLNEIHPEKFYLSTDIPTFISLSEKNSDPNNNVNISTWNKIASKNDNIFIKTYKNMNQNLLNEFENQIDKEIIEDIVKFIKRGE